MTVENNVVSLNTQTPPWQSPAQNLYLNWALWHAGNGRFVFPLDHPALLTCAGIATERHNPQTCQDRGKHPCVAFSKKATTDPAAVTAMFGGGPRNIGVACGPSGLVVLDEDELGALQKFADSIGQTIPQTYLVQTGRGFHYHFAASKALKLGNAEGAFRGKHINVRGVGGYVVAAGSLHKSGALYKVVHNVLPADCPQWVIAAITGDLRAPAAPALGGQSFDAGLLSGAAHEGPIGYGHRHTALVSYAGRLRNKGLTYDEATKLFYDRYRDCIQPPGTVPEARYHAPAPRGPNGEQTVSSEVATWASAVAVLRDVYTRYPEGQPVPPSSTRSPQSADTLLAELLDVNALANRPKAAPLIDGLINRRSLARLYGDPGAYKSFLALDWAIHVALGKEWHGRRVQQGRVVYIVGEGEEGIYKRVRAWEMLHQITGHGVLFLPRPLQATGNEWSVFCQAMQRLAPTLIVLDTQARVTVGVNENDPTDFGRVIENWDQLRTQSGATVLALHHANAEGGRPRGTTAVTGALQTELRVDKVGAGDRRLVRLTVPKQKDDVEEQAVLLRPVVMTVEAPASIWDRAVTSVVLVPTTDDQAELITDTGTAADRILAVMEEHFREGEGGSKAEIKGLLVRTRESPRHSMSKSSFYEAWNRLVEQKRIHRTTDGRQRWLPGPPKKFSLGGDDDVQK
jgi:hypothetical protein